MRALEDECFSGLICEQAPRAEPETIALTRPEPYTRAIEAAPREELVQIDADTSMSPHHRARSRLWLGDKEADDIAERRFGERVVPLSEGGYDLDGLARCESPRQNLHAG